MRPQQLFQFDVALFNLGTAVSGVWHSMDAVASLSSMEHPVDADERRLRHIGYRQILKRDLSALFSFCFSISLYATPLTITSLYTLGFYNGGPVVIIWGWLLVSFFSMFVVLSLAEIQSAFPTAGGIYHQAFYLGGEKWGPLASWWTGWLSWVGFVSGITSVNYLFGQYLGIIVFLVTGSYSPSNQVIFAISCVALLLETIFNAFPIRVLGRIEVIGAIWTAFATIFLIVLIPSVAPTHRTFSYVFTTFYDNSAASGLDSPVYLFSIGLLMSQFSLFGYNVNGHLSEETKSSDSSSPWAMIYSLVSTIITGFALLLAITFSIQDPNNVLNPDSKTGGGLAALQIYYDVFYSRYSSGAGAIVVVGGISACCVFGNAARLAAGSRLFWAMSRDGAVPFSSVCVYVTRQGRVPLLSLLLTSVASLAFALPLCWNAVVFNALTSVSAISTFLGYGLPIFMKLTYGRKRFPSGPLSFGRWSALLNIVSLFWISAASFLFCLPRMFPANWETLNYVPVTFGALFVAVTLPWILPQVLFDFKGGPGHYRKGQLSNHYYSNEVSQPFPEKMHDRSSGAQ